MTTLNHPWFNTPPQCDTERDDLDEYILDRWFRSKLEYWTNMTANIIAPEDNRDYFEVTGELNGYYLEISYSRAD